MAESDTNSSWNAAKHQEKCEWDSSDPKFLEKLADCTIKKSYKDDADESDETDQIYGTCVEHQEHTASTELKKDSMKSSVRKNHLGSNLVVAGGLNDTCLWPTSKKALT